MAKIPWFICVAICLFALLSPTGALVIGDIFTVQGGNTNGGCDARIATLNAWRTECEYSLDEALLAIEDYGQTKKDAKEPGDQTALSTRAERVQAAMNTWFGIKLGSNPDANTIEAIRLEIQYVKNLFGRTRAGEYPRESFWLHCDTTFLEEKDPEDIAETYEGFNIIDDDGDLISISRIPGYQTQLKKDKSIKPWWAGDHTSINAYYFDALGANFCTGDHLGLTAAVEPFERGPDGKAHPRSQIASIIVCPYAFDTSPKPNSYREANNLITAARSFADVVPKSATLLHEAFHALRGNAFLSGKAESTDLGECIGFNAATKRKNPENYVFFIAHMNHLFGEPDGNQPWSIGRNWDFAVQGNARIFGAVSI